MRPHPDQTRFHGVDHEYKVGTTCATPGCINQGAHKHHVWSRTALRKRGGGGWDAVIDQDTGVVLRNLVALCHLHHQMLHDGHALLRYDEADLAYTWADGGGEDELKVAAVLGGLHPPDPPREVEHAEDRALTAPGDDRTLVGDLSSPPSTPEPVGATAVAVAGSETTSSPGDDHAALAPGETCPTCARKVPHPKKKTSPKSRTKAFRVPVDVEADYDQLVEAAAEHLGISKEPFASFHAINAGLVLVLQSPAGLLRKDAA